MNAKKVGLAGAVVAFLASPAGAQTLTVEKARAIVTPFYEALNRPAEKDVAKLLEQATSSDWMSCGGNDACFPREKVIGGFKSRGAILPDLKWEIKEVVVAGDRIIVRGEGSGTPSGTSSEFPLLEKLQDHGDRRSHRRGRQDKANLSCRGLGGRNAAALWRNLTTAA